MTAGAKRDANMTNVGRPSGAKLTNRIHAMSIYLDHAATTPLRREALDAMMPLLTDNFGNPSSVHEPGRRARAALDEARERVAGAIQSEPREIVFTAGGSEAINLAIKGSAW